MRIEEVFPGLHPGSAMRGLRLREGLTREQLARLLGIRRTNLSEMEKGGIYLVKGNLVRYGLFTYKTR